MAKPNATEASGAGLHGPGLRLHVSKSPAGPTTFCRRHGMRLSQRRVTRGAL